MLNLISVGNLGKNPFNQRRQTASEDDLDGTPTFSHGNGQIAKGGERKQTAGTLNRNVSKTELTSEYEQHQDSREVELRAQDGENSQLFMESHLTQSGMPFVNRKNEMQYQSNPYDDDNEIPSMMRGKQKITVNLEDAVLEE